MRAAILVKYISDLEKNITPSSEAEEVVEEEVATEEDPIETENVEETAENDDSGDDIFPPMYESGDDMDQATTYKMEASDLKSAGDYQAALEKFNLAITSAPPSAMLLANRGDILFRLGHFKASVKDCDAALEKNPDSAKALRTRGKSLKSLGEYEKARKDLSAAQMIDYDDGAAEALKFVTEKMKEIEGEKVKKKLEVSEKSIMFTL